MRSWVPTNLARATLLCGSSYSAAESRWFQGYWLGSPKSNLRYPRALGSQYGRSPANWMYFLHPVESRIHQRCFSSYPCPWQLVAGQGRGQHPRGSYGKTVRWESKHFLVGDPSAAELPLALLDSIGAAIVYVGSRRLWNSKEGQRLQVVVLLLCSLCYNLCQLFQQEVLPCSASCLLVLWLYRVPSMCNKLRMMRFGQEIKILNGFTLRRISLFSAFWKSHHAAST